MENPADEKTESMNCREVVMRNHEVINRQLLLDENGQLREPGWSRQLVQEYRREDIKAPKFRIKEWDYVQVEG